MTSRFWLVAAAAAIMATGSCKNADGSADVASFAAIDGDYLKTGGDGSNWAMTGFSYDEQRHSPLTQISTLR